MCHWWTIGIGSGGEGQLVHVGLGFVGLRSNPFFTFHFRPQDDEEVAHAMMIG